jgi:signal transduction histidine kinase
MLSSSRHVDRRYKDVMRKLGAAALGAIVITLLVAVAVRHQPNALGWVTLSLLAQIPVNSWITLVLLRKALHEIFDEGESQRAALKAAHESLTLAVDTRQRVELELLHAQKLEAVGRLASGVAHEINSPLQVVANSLECIGEAAPELLEAFRSGSDVSKAEAHDAASALATAVVLAGEGVKRVASIVASLTEFAQPDKSLEVDVDLNHSVEATLAVAKHEYRRVADVRTELERVPPVRCHPGEINQVLLVLVVNAAEAIAEAAGAEGLRGSIVMRTAIEGGYVVVSVSDTGCGIPPAIRTKIFEPFFTTKAVGRGKGQGLAVARATVGKYGGQLTFESTPGTGTIFSMRLPTRGSSLTDGRQAA